MKSDSQVCGLGKGAIQGPSIKGESQGENYSREGDCIVHVLLLQPRAQSSLDMPTPGCVCVCVCVRTCARRHRQVVGRGEHAERLRPGRWASKGEQRCSQKVLRGGASCPAPFPGWHIASPPSTQASHYLRGKHHMGRVGSWKPSWAATPIPSQPTEALPSSSRSGDKILLVLEFHSEARGACRGCCCRLTQAPRGLHTGRYLILASRGWLTLKGIHKLICSPSGLPRALNLIVESSSVMKKGSRVNPSQRGLLPSCLLHPRQPPQCPVSLS